MDTRTRPTSRRTLLIVAMAALCSSASLLHAQPAGAMLPVEERGVSVVVKTIAEDVLTGDIQSLSPAEGLTLIEAGDVRTIPTEELVRLTTPQSRTARGPHEAVLTLTDGGVLMGRLVGGGDDKVVVDTRDLGSIKLDIDTIATWLTPTAFQEGHRDAVVWLGRGGTAATDSAQDQILLTNGDVVEGYLLAMNSEGVRFESAMGETLLPYRVVVAARFGGKKPTLWNDPHVTVTLRSSGRLVMSEVHWSDTTLRARMHAGPTVRIETQDVVALDFVGGLWEWLPSRQPISVEHTPMWGIDWDIVVDRNVLGGPIVVAGETFEHGIGVHGRTRITYDLRGRYRELVTQFGMDDHSGPFANIDVRILVDGQRRFAHPGVRRGTLFGPVRVDVSRANRVELVTDFGENGDIQDRFNWVETALIR